MLIHRRHSSLGFSILEVLIALGILLAGVVAVAGFFPSVLKANARSIDQSVAAYLAQMKAEEIRRDNNVSGALVAGIRNLKTPTAPATFPLDSRFAYSFSGVSLLYPTVDPADPRSTAGVARIIVRYAANYRPSAEILYELRFDN